MSVLFLSFFFFFFFFSNIYCKINFTPKIGSDLCNFYSTCKLDFWRKKKYRNYFCLNYCNNNVKISVILNKWNMLKTCIKTSYPFDFCIICNHFYHAKDLNFSIFFKPLNRIILGGGGGKSRFAASDLDLHSGISFPMLIL